ncbi:hypothetical protein [Salibacterium halotolerans]|uniref:Uncharacterized protein n=1 Tax=Salibacterium halotolerans TaxID=1884432 RepID=A0A1I5US23_9BACI|nr:hypothetical protein [Salibacterium halotolerans]SFP97526.1 hypothetical protein SAMN05518683_11416 [Salibacterium halotolerans]
MKGVEWVIASIFIIVGLHCLVTAGTLLAGGVEGSTYFSLLLRICFWMCVPILGVFIIYIIIMTIKKQKGKV